MPRYKTKLAGFTLIELLIVTAMAGLIVVLVFFAASQLNRERRDDARKADAARMLNATRQWINGNNGVLPVRTADLTGANGVVPNYITNAGSSFNSPNGAWNVSFTTSAVALPYTSANFSNMYVSAPASCTSNNIVYTSPSTNVGSRQIAVVVYQEGFGSYCISQ